MQIERVQFKAYNFLMNNLLNTAQKIEIISLCTRHWYRYQYSNIAVVDTIFPCSFFIKTCGRLIDFAHSTEITNTINVLQFVWCFQVQQFNSRIANANRKFIFTNVMCLSKYLFSMIICKRQPRFGMNHHRGFILWKWVMQLYEHKLNRKEWAKCNRCLCYF